MSSRNTDGKILRTRSSGSRWRCIAPNRVPVRLLALVAVVLLWLAAPGGPGPRLPAAEGAEPEFSYEDYAAVLKNYVDDRGRVDYGGLKANRKALDEFASAMARLRPATYDAWPDKEKISFWINAYNALTLKTIIDHYPIESSFLRSLVYPASSIRQIPGVFDQIEHLVMGKNMTLDAIEHGTLRAKFNEPRIHVALVCAARSCPPLRTEPYVGSKLEFQLNDQASRFLQSPGNFRMDRQHNTVYLSSILKWFGTDFVAVYGTDKRFAAFSAAERAILNFVSSYRPAEDRTYLETARYSIVFIDYDWSLNEKQHSVQRD